MRRSRSHRVFSASLSLVYLLTSGAFAGLTESNFWALRREHSRQKRGDAILLASSPADVLARLPVVSRSLSPSLSAPVAESLPGGFAENHADLLRVLASCPGSIRKISLPSLGGTNRIVVHIQDVHKNQEAQKSIGRAVAALAAGNQADLVALEGISGPIDLKRFQTFHRPAVVARVADYLLKTNGISGPVQAAMTWESHVPLIGVDDPLRYASNAEAYRRSAPRLPEYNAKLTAFRTDLDRRKASVFNPELKDFDRKATAHHGGTFPLGDYVKTLTSCVPSRCIGPSLRTFGEALAMESALDFKRVESERTELVEFLVKKMDKGQTAALIQWSAGYRTGRVRYADFFKRLQDLCRANGVNIALYPAMSDYIRYVLLSDRIDAEKLFTEMAALENIVYARLAKTSGEKALVEEAGRLRLTQKLMDFSLTPSEWKDYLAAPPAKLGGRPMELDSFECFYREAQARDAAMADNLLKAMEGDKVRTAVLVTGGYHSPGVTEKMKQAGIAIITWVPAIEKLETTQGSAYLSSFTQEKTPLEKLFQGQKLFLADRPTKHIDDGQAALLIAVMQATVGAEGVLDDLHRAALEDPDRAFAALAPALAKTVTIERPTLRGNELTAQIVVGKETTDLAVTFDEKGNIVTAQGELVKPYEGEIRSLLAMAYEVARPHAEALAPEVEWAALRHLPWWSLAQQAAFINLHGNKTRMTAFKRFVGLALMKHVQWAALGGKDGFHAVLPELGHLKTHEFYNLNPHFSDAPLTTTPERLGLVLPAPATTETPPGPYSLPFLGFRGMGLFAPLSYWRSRTDWGMGDLDAFEQVVRFAKKTKQRVLQVLPLQLPIADNCPYAIGSTYVLDPAVIGINMIFRRLGVSAESAVDDYRKAWRTKERLEMKGAKLRRQEKSTNDETRRLKYEVLKTVFRGFETAELGNETSEVQNFLIGKVALELNTGTDLARSFKTYCAQNADWLSDHLLYFILSREFGTHDFSRWPLAVAARAPPVLAQLKEDHKAEILFEAFLQWTISQQVSSLNATAREGEDPVDNMLDQPFAFGPADVWTHLDAFYIDPHTLKREYTQGVPPHRLDIPQHWQFSLLKNNAAAKRLLMERLRYMLRFSSILRIDHLLGYYQLYYMMEDTQWEWTPEKLGIQEELARLFQGGDDPARKRERIYGLILGAMRDRVPEDVRRAAFNEDGSLRANSILLAARRSFPSGSYDRAETGWYSQGSTEHGADLLYSLLSPNHHGSIDYLDKIIREKTYFLKPTDSFRLCYFSPGFGEEIVASFMAEAQRQGKVLVMENLGVVPGQVSQSLAEMGGPQFKPLYFGYQYFTGDHNDYWFDRIGPLDGVYFGYHDTVSVRGWWTGEGEWSSRKYYFKNDGQKQAIVDWLHQEGYLADSAKAPVDQWSRPLQEAVLASVSDSKAGMALFQAPDMFGSGEEGIINMPGQTGFWTARAPTTIEELTDAVDGIGTPSSEARDFVALTKRLATYQARDSFNNQLGSGTPDSPRILATHPLVGPGSKQIAYQGDSFLLDASVVGRVQKAEVVFDDGRRWPMVAVEEAGRNPLRAGVFHLSIPVNEERIGPHAFRFVFNGNVVSDTGYLIGLREGTDSNPLSPTYGQSRAVPAELNQRIPYDGFVPQLEGWLKRQRWFLEKSKTITQLSLRDEFIFPESGNPSLIHGFIIRVQTSEGGRDYYLPFLVSSSPLEGVESQIAVGVGGRTVFLAPAEHTLPYQRAILQGLRDGATLTTGGGNRIVFESSLQARETLAREPTEARDLLKGSNLTTSNVLTEIEVGRSAIVDKTLKSGAGDVEPEMYAALSEQKFSRMVGYYGRVLLETGKEAPLPLCLVVKKNNGPPGFKSWEGRLGYHVWKFFSTLVGRQSERGPDFDGESALKNAWRERVGGGPSYGELVDQMGETMADLHIALANSRQAGFGLQSSTGEDAAHWRQVILRRAHKVESAIAPLDGETYRKVRAKLSDVGTVLAQTVSEFTEGLPPVFLTRVHGDMQLDQVLLGSDFKLKVLDFGGAPLASAQEKREKSLAVQDLAGILRAFGYIKYAVLKDSTHLPPQKVYELLNDPVARGKAGKGALSAANFADTVEAALSRRLVEAYLKTIEARKATNLFLSSWDPPLMRDLIGYTTMSRALYEMDYEVSARPHEEQIPIPLEGLVRWVNSRRAPLAEGEGTGPATTLPTRHPMSNGRMSLLSGEKVERWTGVPGEFYEKWMAGLWERPLLSLCVVGLPAWALLRMADPAGSALGLVVGSLAFTAAWGRAVSILFAAHPKGKNGEDRVLGRAPLLLHWRAFTIGLFSMPIVFLSTGAALTAPLALVIFAVSYTVAGTLLHLQHDATHPAYGTPLLSERSKREEQRALAANAAFALNELGKGNPIPVELARRIVPEMDSLRLSEMDRNGVIRSLLAETLPSALTEPLFRRHFLEFLKVRWSAPMAFAVLHGGGVGKTQLMVQLVGPGDAAARDARTLADLVTKIADPNLRLVLAAERPAVHQMKPLESPFVFVADGRKLPDFGAEVSVQLRRTVGVNDDVARELIRGLHLPSDLDRILRDLLLAPAEKISFERLLHAVLVIAQAA